ncbi:MAG: alpha/beta hydrolase [Alkalibacterium sp.]|nr:alpha/beta hydrolase [Alkalibacterium sp.]
MENKSYEEKEVFIKGQYRLAGTLAIPKGEGKKLPAVLIIPGSGQIDRDGYVENMKFHTNLYKDLAHIVTASGFVSMRVDKRGVGKSQGDFFETGMWDLVEDIEKSIDFLKEQPSVDPNEIILLGHSEGCMLAAAVNARKPVDGLILLSGAAETLEEALKRQREILVEEAKNKNKVNGFLLRLLKADKKVDKQADKFMNKIIHSNKTMMRYNFSKVNAKWFREHHYYNVLEDLKRVNCPVLALTGDKDFQADHSKLGRLPDLIRGDLEYYSIKDMNHGLKKQEGPMSALNFKKEYKEKAKDPIHSEVVERLALWLNKYFDATKKTQ